MQEAASELVKGCHLGDRSLNLLSGTPCGWYGPKMDLPYKCLWMCGTSLNKFKDIEIHF